jgi:hypothetical protein
MGPYTSSCRTRPVCLSPNVGPVGGRSANGWSGWQPVGGPLASIFQGTLTWGANYDGSLVVFITTQIGVQCISQGKAAPYWQGGWQNLNNPVSAYGQSTSAVVAGPNLNGQAGGLLAFVIGSDGQLYENSQKGPESQNWSGWQNIAPTPAGVAFKVSRYWGVVPAAPVVGAGQNGPAVFVCGNDGNVYVLEQTAVGNWGAWQQIIGPGPTLASNAALGWNGPNSLQELFVVGNDGNLYNLAQQQYGTWVGGAAPPLPHHRPPIRRP